MYFNLIHDAVCLFLCLIQEPVVVGGQHRLANKKEEGPGQGARDFFGSAPYC